MIFSKTAAGLRLLLTTSFDRPLDEFTGDIASVTSLLVLVVPPTVKSFQGQALLKMRRIQYVSPAPGKEKKVTDVVKFGADASAVADTVAVAVFQVGRENLIDADSFHYQHSCSDPDFLGAGEI